MADVLQHFDDIPTASSLAPAASSGFWAVSARKLHHLQNGIDTPTDIPPLSNVHGLLYSAAIDGLIILGREEHQQFLLLLPTK